VPGQFALHHAAIAAAILAPVVFLIAWFALRRARRALVILLVVLALPYAPGVWAFLVEPQMLAIRHVEVRSAQWTDAPLRIGVITDTHVGGPAMPVERMNAIVEKMNAEKPDLVVLLGDYVTSDEPAELRSHLERSVALQGVAAFAGLIAPRGVYAVIGNHDVLYDADTIRTALENANVRVLENDAVPVPGASGYLVGLGEYSMQGADFAAASQLAPEGSPLIVLMHWPDSIKDINARAVLSLAGHTHCGQMGVPGLDKLFVASPASRDYRCGLYDVGGLKLYVSGGVGQSILPMRLLAPPEVGVVTLRGTN
jgi:predicted MPP superfamily phosphohydrolase